MGQARGHGGRGPSELGPIMTIAAYKYDGDVMVFPPSLTCPLGDFTFLATRDLPDEGGPRQSLRLRRAVIGGKVWDLIATAPVSPKVYLVTSDGHKDKESKPPANTMPRPTLPPGLIIELEAMARMATGIRTTYRVWP